VSRRDTYYVMVVAVAVLVVARLLTPASDGYGTHRFLMMPPCLFRAATHLPCPLCGLTTAFVRMAHGDAVGAFEAHLLGPGLFAATVLVAVSSLLAIVSSWVVPQRILAALYSSQLAYWLLVMVLIAWPASIYLHIVRN
jgi:hypothetical protein